MSAIDVNGLISGFDAARREFRDAEMKQAHAREDREYSLLSALAQHTDPEMAALGATALLGLAGGSGPKLQKGLRGFLGEVEQSSALGPIRQFLGAGETAAAAAMPGSAAQPDSAVVDPERQAQGPGISQMPPEVAGTDMEAPGLEDGGGGEPAAGLPTRPPGLGMVAPPMPPRPETPQQRSRRLFPSAADVAAETTFRQLQGRLNATLQAIRQAGGGQNEQLDAVMGTVGAPRRAVQSKVLNAQFRTADGQELEGSVIFDPVAQTATFDGQPVTILKQLPTNLPRPIRQSMNTNGTRTDVYLDPRTFEQQATVHTGIPIPEPPKYSSTVTTPDGTFQVQREGGLGPRLGDAPLRAGELNAEQQQATTWLTDVQAEVKAALAAANRNVFIAAQKQTALPTAQQNQIVQKITGGRYKTLGELTTATKRTTGAGDGGTSAPSAPSMRDRANRVRQRLESTQPGRVQGSGVPQTQPPPRM